MSESHPHPLEVEEASHPSSVTDSSRGPACDPCRSRKVRCDRKVPCSHCQTARLQCRTTKRVAERRQRISVSGRYDDEIKSVHGRLASLERMLETFMSNQSSNNSSSSPASTSTGPTLSAPRDNQLLSSDPDFEGDSSFSAHSRDITQVIERGLRSSAGSESDGDVEAAVATLRNFLNEKSPQSDIPTPPQTTLRNVVDYPELSNLTLPSMPAVLNMLRYIKTHPLRYLEDVPNLSVARLTSICQRVYFPTEEFTIATFITVHVYLLNIFRELSQSQLRDLDLTVVERDQIVATSAKNAETAVRNLRLYMPSTYENIEALVLGATLAMDISQSSLAWSLVTAASRMAQDAGYHRLPPYSVAPEVTEQRRFFWFLYCVERGMALNLGRSCTMRDHDIQTERPKYPEEISGLWGALFSNWFDFAQAQGDIYDQLYCARAQKEPVEAKAERARKLGTRIRDIQDKFHVEAVYLERMPFGDFVKEGLLSVGIVINSTLTMVYRMIPPTPASPSSTDIIHPLKPCSEALESARQALNYQAQAWQILYHRSKDDWRLFVHWTLLWCPFVPFTVLVGNVIAERDVNDLKLLEKSVETLHGAAALSAAVSKLYRACRIFYQIAKIYLRHPKTERVEEQHPQQTINPKDDGSRSRSLPTAAVPSNDFQHQTTAWQPPETDVDIDLPDFPLSQQDWNGMLDDWDLGLGAENAREMSMYFEQYLSGATSGMGAPPS